MYSTKKAFTMMELIFVIVVMGILSKFGVEILRDTYENYIFTTTQSKLQIRTELTVEQIATRLKYRIKPSVIARDNNSSKSFRALVSAHGSTGGLTPESILEWVGYDIDGFRGTDYNATAHFTYPNWSGIIDLNATGHSTTKLITPHTDFSEENSLVSNLTYGQYTASSAVVYMVGTNPVLSSFGWGSPTNNALTDQIGLKRITAGTDNELTPKAGTGNYTGQEIYEYYQLAYTAYAIVHTPPDVAHNVKGVLTLYYNYRPWEGEEYGDGESTVLATDIDTFGFRSIGSQMIKIQICSTDSDIFKEGAYSVCKEKTIF